MVQRRVDHRRLDHLRMGHPFIGWMYMRTFNRKVVSKRMPNEECVLSGWFIKGSIIYKMNVHESLFKEGGGAKSGCYLDTGRVDFMMEVQRRDEVKD